jgi:polar amino acid transport system permease protein
MATTPESIAASGHAETDPPDRGPEVIVAVPVRHPWRWVVAAFLGLLMAMLIHSLLTNPAWHWSIVWKYLTYTTVLHGIIVTLELTVLAMLIGVVLGIILAVMRLSANPVVSSVAWTYVWFFRGTPVLVQIIFWSFAAALYQFPTFGIPFGPAFVTFDANKIIPLFVGALLGLGLNEAAYMSEIVRAGLLSVDHGQTEAAQALGLSKMATLRRIVLPQAMRVIIPPTGNETISMLKTTSIVSVIGYAELTFTAQIIGARTFQVIPLFITISIWYLAMTSVLTVGQYYLERYFARGSSRALPPTPGQRLRGLVTR